MQEFTVLSSWTQALQQKNAIVNGECSLDTLPEAYTPQAQFGSHKLWVSRETLLSSFVLGA